MEQRDTRTALMDAAERVFARDGFERASMRAIMRDAGANPAAVHYHFGGKPGLLQAVLERVVAPLNARRLDLLSDLRSHSDGAALATRALVEAFLHPDFEAITALQDRGPGRAAFIGRAYGQPNDEVRMLMYRQFDPVAEAFVPEFCRALADVPADQVRWRLRWCVVGVIVSLFSNADLPDGPVGEVGMAEAERRAVDFVTAGLAAP